MEPKRLRITKKHVSSFNLNEQLIHRPLEISDPIQIKVYLLDFSTKFFYALIENIRRDYGHFKNRIYLIFINHVHSFIKKLTNCNSSLSSLSQQVFFDAQLFQKYLEFVTVNKNVFKANKEVNLKLTFINPDWQEVDRFGYRVVLHWLNKKIKYDSFGAAFSTIGGACSSLGEELHFQAVNAEVVSHRQLKLAEEFQDPNAICKSQMFLALSYIQLAKFKEAKEILDYQHILLNDPNHKDINDDRLRVMCIAVKNKWKLHKYFYKKYLKGDLVIKAKSLENVTESSN